MADYPVGFCSSSGYEGTTGAFFFKLVLLCLIAGCTAGVVIGYLLACVVRGDRLREERTEAKTLVMETGTPTEQTWNAPETAEVATQTEVEEARAAVARSANPGLLLVSGGGECYHRLRCNGIVGVRVRQLRPCRFCFE